MFLWYLIRTKPTGEVLAESNLRRQGYDVYLPRLVKSVRQRGRSCEKTVALFPRYLFLRLEEGRQSLGPVRSTTGVSDIVRFGFNHAVVPDRIIRDLRARADARTGLHRLNSSALASGMTVQVTWGPFGGLEGVFEREAGGDRVVVLLHVLGDSTRVRLPVDFVVPSQAFT